MEYLFEHPCFIFNEKYVWFYIQLVCNVWSVFPKLKKQWIHLTKPIMEPLIYKMIWEYIDCYFNTFFYLHSYNTSIVISTSLQDIFVRHLSCSSLKTIKHSQFKSHLEPSAIFCLIQRINIPENEIKEWISLSVPSLSHYQYDKNKNCVFGIFDDYKKIDISRKDIMFYFFMSILIHYQHLDAIDISMFHNPKYPFFSELVYVRIDDIPLGKTIFKQKTLDVSKIRKITVNNHLDMLICTYCEPIQKIQQIYKKEILNILLRCTELPLDIIEYIFFPYYCISEERILSLFLSPETMNCIIEQMIHNNSDANIIDNMNDTKHVDESQRALECLLEIEDEKGKKDNLEKHFYNMRYILDRQVTITR